MDEVYLQEGVGIFYLILGVSFLVHANNLWLPLTQKLKDPAYVVFLGLFSTTIGTFMIIGHNIWSLNPSEILTTVTGWGIFLEGIRYLIFHKTIYYPKSLKNLRFLGAFISITAGALILGGIHWMR